MEYLNFDLRLAEWNPGSRTGVAEVLASPAGEGKRHLFLLDLDIAAHAERAQRTLAQAIELGRKLAEGVLSPGSHSLWEGSCQIARERDRGLRLRLHIDSWELARLPWELLYDGRRGDFLVFDPLISLVRYLRLHTTPPALRQRQSLRVLAAVTSPRDLAPLDWQRELGVLGDALHELVDAGQAEIIPCEHTTHEKLHLALLEWTPDVVHFVGHGAYDREQHLGVMILEDEQGLSAPLGALDAARLLRRYGVTLVVLNACETAQGVWAGLAPALVRAETPAVVAMQWPVEDRAAIRFSRTFYKALSLGKTIDECVAEGRMGASASSSDPNDWAAPVLFLRSLSGRLWANDITRLRERRAALPLPREAVLRDPTGAFRALPPQDGPLHFKTRGPLQPAIDAGLIIDRPELRRAIRLAQQPSVTQYIALLSARQTGKTTILFRLMECLQESYACVFIDLSVLRAQDVRACYRFVAFRLVSEFHAFLGDSSLLPERPQIESSVDFLEFLRELADSVPLPRLILLLDEVGALSPEVSDSFFNTVRTVFSQGRGPNSQLSKYLFVFSGAVDLYALTAGTNSPLNICERLYLRDLEPADVERIVAQLARLGMTVPPSAPGRIYGLTGGHPYLTMRLCALLERAEVKELTPEKIEMVAEQMLVEDDNIRHVIHELERRPPERRRLRSILVEGRQVPFSRNDPVLASLEMIGAIRPTQPCEVRNRLYERALRQYYTFAETAASAGHDLPLAKEKGNEEIEAMYARLQTLRAEALDARNLYRIGKAWETFASALFSTVSAFSVYPDLHANREELDIVLAINDRAPGGSYWSTYQPAILVECRNMLIGSPEAVKAELLGQANQHGIKLVLAMTSGATRSSGEERVCRSGTRGDTTLVFLDDAEIAQLLAKRDDLDHYLRGKVLEARLHRI